jgi:hypothetical protein
MPIPRVHTTTLAAILAAGCSAGATHALVVGTEATGGTGGTAGAPGTRPGNGGGTILLSVDASALNTLSAHIESPPGITVEFITLSCDAACADVLVVAKGGRDPYSYTWEDGSTNPGRRVCPTESTRYEVIVTDTGSTSVEFTRAAQTVKALLTASVLKCRDAGIPTDGGGEETCGAGFKPGVYEGTFKQALGPLSGTDVISLMKSAGTATQETISGRLDNVLAGSGTAASTTWGEGSAYYCSTQRLFLTGVEAGFIPLPYTYEATYNPANDTLLGSWAAAAPPSPGVFPTSALDTGTWEAHWVRP